MAKYKITLIEGPRIKSIWRRGTEGTILGSIRQRTPLHTQPIVAGKLRQALGDDYAVEIVDARLRTPEHEELYKVMPYGDGVLEHYRVGLSFEGDQFKDIAKTSDVLGLTVNFTQTAGVATDLAVKARQLNPGIKIVFGGSDVRARPGHYLGAAGADAVVLGDGERSGPPLIRQLLGDGCLEGIPAIAYLDNGSLRGGQSNFARVPMGEVAEPAFDLVAEDLPRWTESHEGPLPNGVEPPLAYVETSRGCHETCPFCYTAGVSYRMMSNEQIEQYSKHLRDWGFRSLMMIADNELTPLLMQRVKGLGMSGRDLLLERYRIFREHGFNWEFSNGLQYSMFYQNGRLDEELIDAMFPNCYRLFTPVEDPVDLAYDKLYGSPAERRRSSQKTTDEVFHDHHIQVLARIAATGLPMMTFGLIFGWPGDTVDRVHRVTERCKILSDAIHAANPDCHLFFTPFIGIPIPGTRNWIDYTKQGLIHEDVVHHPETWQYTMTTYGNHEMVDERLDMIRDLNGAKALAYWTETGRYPHLAMSA